MLPVVRRCTPFVGSNKQPRRLYDCLITVLDKKDEDFGEVRRVLESGMKNGAVSLMKDVSEAEGYIRVVVVSHFVMVCFFVGCVC